MTDSQPLVSIIVATYNSDKTIIDSLESVYNQTYKNLQLIIADDCSIDTTVSTCLKWKAKNENRFTEIIIVEMSQNAGIAPNVNNGLKVAKGEWVKYFAGDDVLLPNCIQDNIDFILQDREINICFSNIIEFHSNPETKNYIRTINQKEEFVANYPDQFRSLLKGNFINSPSNFIKRSLLVEFGGFDERFPMLEDYPLWLKITQAGYKIYYLPKDTVLYRIHNSISSPRTSLINERYLASKVSFFYMVKIFLYPPEMKNYKEKERKALLFYEIGVAFLNNKISIWSRILWKICHGF